MEIHDCLTKANFNAYIWRYGKRFYGPIGQDGMVTQTGYVLSQFARFVKPGSIRLGTSASSRSDVMISACNHSGKKIFVAINNGRNSISQKITLQDAAIAEVVPCLTSRVKNCEPGTKITAANNSLSYLLPSKSIVTFVEQ